MRTGYWQSCTPTALVSLPFLDENNSKRRACVALLPGVVTIPKSAKPRKEHT